MRPLMAICGVAEGLGLAQARLFARNGFDVMGVARSDRAASKVAAAVGREGGSYQHRIADLTRPDDVAAALGAMDRPLEAVIHNVHRLAIAPFLETGMERFEEVWRVNCLSAAHVAQAVLPGMRRRGGGALIFTGATAGLRGGDGFAAFAASKFALRGLTQSLAREFGPKGVHVAHVVIDGLIDEPQTSGRFGESVEPGSRLDPDALAQSYLHLVLQPRSCWTQEIDVRPSREKY